MKRDGQDIIVVDVFSEAAELPVTVAGAEFLGWGNGDPRFRHLEPPSPYPGRASGDPASAESALTIYPFAGRAQILIRSVEGSDSPITLTVGSASLNF